MSHPLQTAAKRGRVEDCRAYVDAGVPPDSISPEQSDTPLVLAAREGHADVVRLLLGAGARVDGKDDDCVTPLFVAAMSGKLEAVKLLLEAGADLHRESLTQPLTPTAAAEYWAFANTDQRAVAEYLRSIGGTNPYNEASRPEDVWNGVPGEMQIELVERALQGRVSPLPHRREVEAGQFVTVHSCRFPRTTYLFRLLFTVDLGAATSCELALALPSRWPLHTAALREPAYAWPLEFLFGVAASLIRGLRITHGDVISRGDELVTNLDWPPGIEQWLVVRHESLDERRRAVPQASLVETHFLIPHIGKPIEARDDARKRADAKAKVKWARPASGTGRNALVVPLDTRSCPAR